jgi:hypothetical protein
MSDLGPGLFGRDEVEIYSIQQPSAGVAAINVATTTAKGSILCAIVSGVPNPDGEYVLKGIHSM